MVKWNATRNFMKQDYKQPKAKILQELMKLRLEIGTLNGNSRSRTDACLQAMTFRIEKLTEMILEMKSTTNHLIHTYGAEEDMSFEALEAKSTPSNRTVRMCNAFENDYDEGSSGFPSTISLPRPTKCSEVEKKIKEIIRDRSNDEVFLTIMSCCPSPFDYKVNVSELSGHVLGSFEIDDSTFQAAFSLGVFDDYDTQCLLHYFLDRQIK